MGGNSRKRSAARRNAAAKAAAAPQASQAQLVDEAMDTPTHEQAQKVRYQKVGHTDEMGIAHGFGYRREPWFETLAKTKDNAVTQDELVALRFYRAAFDRCERSPTKSCLNVGVGGGLRDAASGILMATPAIMEAKRKVRLCEEVLGIFASTVRAVGLQDRSFSDIAIERFGGRDQHWIDVKDPAQPSYIKIVPKSGRHRDAIRKEFYAGLRLLTKRVRILVSTPGIEEVWVEPGNPLAFIRRGAAAPNGLYRLWGDSERVDDLMSRLRDSHGDDLHFPTPQDARAALDDADGGRLSRLSEQELAR